MFVHLTERVNYQVNEYLGLLDQFAYFDGGKARSPKKTTNTSFVLGIRSAKRLPGRRNRHQPRFSSR